jgi:hypothetical protein
MDISPEESCFLLNRWYYGSHEDKVGMKQLIAHLFAPTVVEILQMNLQNWCSGCSGSCPDLMDHQCWFTPEVVSLLRMNLLKILFAIFLSHNYRRWSISLSRFSRKSRMLITVSKHYTWQPWIFLFPIIFIRWRFSSLIYYLLYGTVLFIMLTCLIMPI